MTTPTTGKERYRNGRLGGATTFLARATLTSTMMDIFGELFPCVKKQCRLVKQRNRSEQFGE